MKKSTSVAEHPDILHVIAMSSTFQRPYQSGTRQSPNDLPSPPNSSHRLATVTSNIGPNSECNSPSREQDRRSLIDPLLRPSSTPLVINSSSAYLMPPSALMGRDRRATHTWLGQTAGSNRTLPRAHASQREIHHADTRPGLTFNFAATSPNPYQECGLCVDNLSGEVRQEMRLLRD